MFNPRIRALAGAAAVALSFMGSASAGPTINAGGSSIFFNNYEILYRSEANCAAVPGSCLAENTTAGNGDPAGYRRVDASIGGNVFAGDLFVGILNVQNIQDGSLTDSYNSVAGNRFTGYFVQQVVSATGGVTGTITLGTAAVDPFGILAAGEMFRLYSNMPGFTAGGTLASSIASATTGGTFWGSLGLGSEGYAYTLTNLTLPVNQSGTEAYLALDIMVKGPGYTAGDLRKINDFNEDIVGGTVANPSAQLCSLAEIATPGISCTDIVGTSEIEANSAFGTGASPWIFASNDPFELNKIPEPGSLALAGLALLGVGALRRRKAQ